MKANELTVLVATEATPVITWKENCPSCKKNHIVTNKPCPSCGVYTTPQPISETVYNNCRNNYICEGCESYNDRF